MFVVLVEFTARPGKDADMLSAIRQQAHNSLTREPACRRFDVCTDPDNPALTDDDTGLLAGLDVAVGVGDCLKGICPIGRLPRLRRRNPCRGSCVSAAEAQ